MDKEREENSVKAGQTMQEIQLNMDIKEQGAGKMPRKEWMKMQIESRSENEEFARVTVAVFMSRMDPTLEEINDVKTAVSEAVTNCVIHGYGNGEGIIYIEAGIEEDELSVWIRDEGKGIEDIRIAMEPMYTSDTSGERSGMGFSFMEAFMDQVEVESEPGRGTMVKMKKKIGMFCDVEPEAVINNLTADSIYEVPLLMEQEGLDHIALKKLGLEDRPVDMEDWKAMVERMTTAKKEVQIALVGKYVRLHDAYLSVAEALSHAGYAMGAKVNIRWINSEILEEEKPDLDEVFAGIDGIVVPGGFGYRGVEGKIDAIRYARENKIPFLGLCLGMQCAVIEFARNVCHMEQANSSEFIPDGKYPVIDLMPDQEDVTEKGGTMRLGIYPCKLKEGTRARTLYENQEIVYERHRHRYEVSNEFRPQMEAAGLVISGTSPDDRLVEIIELKDHPYFAATQAHPEFKSRPNRPHPLFNGFMEAAVKQSGE